MNTEQQAISIILPLSYVSVVSALPPQQGGFVSVDFPVKKIIFKPVVSYFSTEPLNYPVAVFCDLVDLTYPVAITGHFSTNAASGSGTQWISPANDTTFIFQKPKNISRFVGFRLGNVLDGNAFTTATFTGVLLVTMEFYSE